MYNVVLRSRRLHLWPVFELWCFPGSLWFMGLDSVVKVLVSALAVHTCIISSAQRLKDVSTLFYVLEWIYCPALRRYWISTRPQPFPTSLWFLLLCCTPAGVWGLHRDSCCSCSHNWFQARWSHDRLLSSTIVISIAAQMISAEGQSPLAQFPRA